MGEAGQGWWPISVCNVQLSVYFVMRSNHAIIWVGLHNSSDIFQDIFIQIFFSRSDGIVNAGDGQGENYECQHIYQQNIKVKTRIQISFVTFFIYFQVCRKNFI